MGGGIGLESGGEKKLLRTSMPVRPVRLTAADVAGEDVELRR